MMWTGITIKSMADKNNNCRSSVMKIYYSEKNPCTELPPNWFWTMKGRTYPHTLKTVPKQTSTILKIIANFHFPLTQYEISMLFVCLILNSKLYQITFIRIGTAHWTINVGSEKNHNWRSNVWGILSSYRLLLRYLNFQISFVKNNKFNKRPRGLCALLGHLLVKRIPVTYQLSSTKIPEYLTQK